MEFDSIKAQILKTEPDTVRTDSEDYFEAVVGKARLEEVVRVLGGVFGPPVWPSNQKPSKETERLVRGVGGLRKGQMLYFLNNKSGLSAYAMLWPWQDGEKTTLKMSKI